jgi:8-oxo-dGTP pyrophosphatase MutT (NUDIX family)
MTTANPVLKVAAVVTRASTRGVEVLVFEHPQDDGGVMVQLPAGTIEPGEAPEVAVLRELFEETGVTGELEAFAGVLDEKFEAQARRRWVYLVRAVGDVAEEWPFTCDCGAPVRCVWSSIDAPIHPAQQPWLDVARDWLVAGRAGS